VFLCIALTHSATDTIYTPCGKTARDLLVALVVTVLCAPIVFAMVAGCVHLATNAHQTLNWAVPAVLLLIYSVGILLVLGLFTLRAAADTFRSPACVAAMSSVDDGMYSPSANTGVPLLGIMGLIQGLRCVCLGASVCLYMLIAIAGACTGILVPAI
jgi:hypothetical protein